ncbi:MAG: cupredoxin domain-containing protein [Dehalococcoidia bacterium]|nr:cupredoxin domain-containing protein [Dehalococcoidia bacterium]
MPILTSVRGRLFVALLALAVVLLLAAACSSNGGGGGDKTPATGQTPAAGQTPTGGIAPQPERPATAQEVQEQAFTPTDGRIELGTRDNFFGKNHFQVTAGQTVTFVVRNTGNSPHTFTIAGVDGKFGTADDFDTGDITSGQESSLEVTLDTAGTYVFRCNEHPTEMWGETDVEAPQSSGGGY